MESFKTTPYTETMAEILKNGVNNGNDRTGKGRRHIFGVINRYDLSNGQFPVDTTRKIFMRGGIVEMLMLFIKGSGRITELKNNKVPFWNEWAVKEENIDSFIEEILETSKEQRHSDPAKTPEELEKEAVDFRVFMKSRLMATSLDGIGPMYGVNWRNAPNDRDITPFHPVVPIEEMPSDKVAIYEAAWTNMMNGVMEGQVIPDGAKLKYFNDRYYSTVDQFNELLRGLKNRPHSSRHVVISHIPQSVPFEELTPEKNVLIGKGALAACHVMFQCFVKPPLVEGGKKRLSLMMTQRSADWAVGVATNQAQYAFLTHALAHVSGMDADEFIHSVGDAHLYFNHIENAKEQITRSALPYPTIKFNPEATDIFKMTYADVTIEGYDSHPAIVYEVAK